MCLIYDLVPVPLSPHHCIRLAAASLSVGKDTHIVAVEGVLDNILPEVFVYLGLRNEVGVPRIMGPVRMVKCEIVRFA